ncbi:unnamed protein product [Adineta steineri]|uniref:Uncharacterized protein n=1 Tax=Adineta steineri TaxID=433720 RepID=A0A814ZBQ2_9BILA|nr:unnamed protein product [Adineta steineri]CAF1528511.1 unnamed protein product [Adineta steineri]
MAFNVTYADTLHQHVVMWVDPSIGEVGDNERMKERFRRVTHPLYTFIDAASAVKFIEEQRDAGKTVFLITSGRLARELVPQVYDFPCVITIFIYCAKIKDYIDWATDYIEKVLMFDFDEELLIRLTNEIANYLEEEAKKYENNGNVESASGLLDWAAWLYNDASTLEQAACRAILENIRKRRQKLNIDHQIAHPNQFNNQ